MNTIPEVDLNADTAESDAARLAMNRMRLEGPLAARLEAYRNHRAAFATTRRLATVIPLGVMLAGACYLIINTWTRPRTIEDAVICVGALAVVIIYSMFEEQAAKAAHRLREQFLGVPVCNEIVSVAEMTSWIASLPPITKEGKQRLEVMVRTNEYGFNDIEWWIYQEVHGRRSGGYEAAWQRHIEPMLHELKSVRELNSADEGKSS